jgi:hypothetical protein
MTADERLIGCQLKIDRANQHIRDLQAAIDKFIWSKPHLFDSKDDLESGERSFYVRIVPDIPFDPISLLAGDALQNLRSTLDHLAFQIVGSPADITPEIRRISFPIGESPAHYKSLLSRREIQTLRPDAVEAIDALKPYKGGDNTLWLLHSLNIIDKHRLLISACAVNVAHSIPASIKAELVKGYFGSNPGAHTAPV